MATMHLHSPRILPRPLPFSFFKNPTTSVIAIPRRFRRRNLSSACGARAESLVARLRKEKDEEKDEEEEEEGMEVAGGHGSGDLKSWLSSQGLPPCRVVLKEMDSHGRNQMPIHYVAASEVLQEGDVAFSVPSNLIVTLERVLGNETVAELLTTNKLLELACLALYLMYDEKQGKDSFWYPFIRELDRQRGRGQLAVESPLVWPETELAYLNGSPTRAEVFARGEGIKREYNELDTVWFMAGSLFQQYPFDIPTEAFPFEIFKQAFVAVQSCVVHLQAMLKAVGDAVQLVADRPYKDGEAIVVWCGPQPNSRLLLNYGFVDEDDPYDRLAIEASLDTNDPQYQEKRIVAQRNGKLSVQVCYVYVGKEKEAISDMLPYLRLGYLSDPSEMQSVSPGMERAVLSQLSDYFKDHLAGYPTTLHEDENLIPTWNQRKE